MEVSQDTYILDGHQVTLSKRNNHLLLDIEAKPIGRHFVLELENDAIPQATNEIFADIDTMHQGLKDALRKIYKEAVLVFDGKEKLTYKVSFSLGAVKKDLGFSLLFQVKEKEGLDISQEKIAALRARDTEGRSQPILNNNQEIEDRIQRLEVENRILRDKFDDFEKRVFEKLEALEQKVASSEVRKRSKSPKRSLSKRKKSGVKRTRIIATTLENSEDDIDYPEKYGIIFRTKEKERDDGKNIESRARREDKEQNKGVQRSQDCMVAAVEESKGFLQGVRGRTRSRVSKRG